MTTGLFLVAAVGDLADPAVFTPVAKVAYPVALVLLLVDLVCLVLDLGDPLRFHHMLRVFKPWSPMSVGTWCLTIYSLPLTAVVAIGLLSELELITVEWPRKLAVVIGVLPALGSAAYKGVLLSINSQPGWKDARWLGGYLTNSAILLGCAELLVLSAVMGEGRVTAVLRTAFIVLLTLNVVPLALLFVDLRPTLARLYTPRQLWVTVIFSVVTATVIPLCLAVVAHGPVLMFPAVVFVMLGSLIVRFQFVKIPHTSPM